AAGGRDQLFLPWYLGYRIHHQASVSAANVLQEELSKAIPGSKFAVRTAPLAVLSSATMPSVLLESGNFNNPVNAQTLADDGFQRHLADALVNAILRFSESPQAAANYDANAYQDQSHRFWNRRSDCDGFLRRHRRASAI